MKENKHGVVSIILFSLAILTALIAIFIESRFIAGVYAIFILVGFLSIIYSYCTKCEARFSCSHIVLGKIAQWMPGRSSPNYSITDYLGVIIPLLLIITVPQVWLWKVKWMFATFWLLNLAAALEINSFVCTRCTNLKCAICKNKCTV